MHIDDDRKGGAQKPLRRLSYYSLRRASKVSERTVIELLYGIGAHAGNLASFIQISLNKPKQELGCGNGAGL